LAYSPIIQEEIITMAKENENKGGGFFKILKQFVTGDSDPNNKKVETPVPENEEQLEKLMSKISPQAMENARKKEAEILSTPAPDFSNVSTDTELQTAEVAAMLQFVAKMDKPGPQYAYFEFLKAKDGIGPIDPGMERVVLKTILSSLSTIPDLKGVNADLLIQDAERQLKLLMEFSGKRLMEIESAGKSLSHSKMEQVRNYNTEIGARKKAIESLQREIVELESRVKEAQDEQAKSAAESVHQLNAARGAADKVNSKIERDIAEVRKYLIPPVNG
jgi:hypothetical protein